MNNPHIMIAEDDNNILTGLVATLESEGYDVSTANDGEKALELYKKNRFDLVLLDIMMPGKSGYDICREIRSHDNETPIIMLTAKGEEIDKVVGLQLGADDYVTKPFGVHELLARISAVLRRSQRISRPKYNDAIDIERFSFGPVEVDVKQYKLTNGKDVIPLSEREVRLLHFFYSHPNEVLSRDRLLNAVWGIDYYGTTRTLDQHIAQLRKKVEPDTTKPSIIKTVHRVGYRYDCER